MVTGENNNTRRLSAAVVIAAWARAKDPPWCALQPRDIGELMCASREWRNELLRTDVATEFVTSFVRNSLPGMVPPGSPAATLRELVGAILSGRVRLGALCGAVAAMNAASIRDKGAPYRKSLGSLVDGSLWCVRSDTDTDTDTNTNGAYKLSALSKNTSTIVVLDALVRLASRLVSAATHLSISASQHLSTGTAYRHRSRTDMRPWTLYAMFHFALCQAHRIEPDVAELLVEQANTALDIRWRDANRGLHHELRSLLRLARSRLRHVIETTYTREPYTDNVAEHGTENTQTW